MGKFKVNVTMLLEAEDAYDVAQQLSRLLADYRWEMGLMKPVEEAAPTEKLTQTSLPSAEDHKDMKEAVLETAAAEAAPAESIQPVASESQSSPDQAQPSKVKPAKKEAAPEEPYVSYRVPDEKFRVLARDFGLKGTELKVPKDKEFLLFRIKGFLEEMGYTMEKGRNIRVVSESHTEQVPDSVKLNPEDSGEIAYIRKSE